MKRILAFPYFGGKYSHLRWLLPLLPETRCYCEPFGGSAAVLINRSPSKVETYNDLDGDVVNFFRVLREQPEELIRLIKLTPYSRREFAEAVSSSGDLSRLEAARRFYVRIRQGYSAMTKASAHHWAWGVRSSHACIWARSTKSLLFIAERFRRVQLEDRDALHVIDKCDASETLFYCDPPYPGRHERNYRHTFSHGQLFELVEKLNTIRGLAAVSGYRDETVDEIFKGWNRCDAVTRPIGTKAHYADRRFVSAQTRQEFLWTNYSFRFSRCRLFPRLSMFPRFRLFPRE